MLPSLAPYLRIRSIPGIHRESQIAFLVDMKVWSMPHKSFKLTPRPCLLLLLHSIVAMSKLRVDCQNLRPPIALYLEQYLRPSPSPFLIR